jgi:hypothetical protein
MLEGDQPDWLSPETEESESASGEGDSASIIKESNGKNS